MSKAPAPCPYCGSLARSENGLRDHLVRRCTSTPPEIRIATVVKYADTYSEAEWSSLVVARFRDAGWMCFHAERGRGRDGDWMTNTGDDGLPDWLFIRPPTMLFVELKRQKGGKASAQQVRVISAIQQCTQVEGYFARPAQFGNLMAIAALGV